MNPAARFLTACVVLVGLSACEESESAGVSKSLLDNPAARGNDAEQMFLSMRDLCIRKPITFEDAKQVTGDLDLGLRVDIRGWDDFSTYGTNYFWIKTNQPTRFEKGANAVPKGTVFKQYYCRGDFRGTWADEIATELAKELTANGFQTIQPLKRTTGKTRVGTDTVGYSGLYRRDGVDFKVNIFDAAGTTKRSTATQTETSYISGTRVEINGL
ncbi:hypothetical protein ABLN87_16265 [Ruegeria sp. SCPT10]|uniref:hypothetical protein n=1 Tax=Ruegeria sp. SCP10 TaxID=3141377 RepID=UPI00333DD59C